MNNKQREQKGLNLLRINIEINNGEEIPIDRNRWREVVIMAKDLSGLYLNQQRRSKLLLIELLFSYMKFNLKSLGNRETLYSYNIIILNRRQSHITPSPSSTTVTCIKSAVTFKKGEWE